MTVGYELGRRWKYAVRSSPALFARRFCIYLSFYWQSLARSEVLTTVTVNYLLPGCDAVKSGAFIPTFRRNLFFCVFFFLFFLFWGFVLFCFFPLSFSFPKCRYISHGVTSQTLSSSYSSQAVPILISRATVPISLLGRSSMEVHKSQGEDALISSLSLSAGETI